MRPRNRTIRTVLLAILLASFGASAQALAGRQARQATPHARSSLSFQIGIGDEQSEMFTNSLWQQLHTKIVRYIAPYDTALHPYWLSQATTWIHEAEAEHQQVLVAFYHSEYTPTKMPSVSLYQKDVQKFVKLFPHVRQYQPWDEANRGNVRGLFSSPSAPTAAKYYQALKRVCKGCTLVGLDILDQDNPSTTLTYISEFKREIYRLETVMPKIWGLHDYSDVNRLEDWRTLEIDRALGGEIWLTETGGIVKFGRGFPNNHGSGLKRAAKTLEYTFKVARSQPQIKRLYIYDWTGGTASTRFDAGLMDIHFRPREGYEVVCKELHASKCAVKLASD
jgi:hypothetical protein